MHFSSRLVVALIIAHSSLCQVLTEQSWPMDRWLPSGNDISARDPQPVWYKQTRLAGIAAADQPSDPKMWTYSQNVAQAHYNWVSTQPNADGRTENVLVAVMWGPSAQTFYASTIPRGSQRAFMYLNGQSAPRWQNALGATMTNQIPLHAEDGCWFNWERANPGRPYPQNAVVGIYGKYKNQPTAKMVMPCTTRGGLKGDPQWPGCQKVAKALPVLISSSGYQPTAQQIQQQEQDDDQDLDGGVPDELFACFDRPNPEAPGAGPLPRAASNSSACPNLQEPLPTDVTTISSVSLPVSTLLPSSNMTSTPSASPYKTITTAASIFSNATATSPSVSCSYQDGTPETPQACVCVSGSSTTSVGPMTLSSVSIYSQSCDYSTWPGSKPAITTTPSSISTNFAGCEICTFNGGPTPNCEAMPSSAKCTPQSTLTSLNFGTSGITVGTLTGSALYTSVTAALDKACSPPAYVTSSGNFTCNAEATITVASNIGYVVDQEYFEDGELTMQVDLGEYQDLDFYNLAKTAIGGGAANSSTYNCGNQTVQVDTCVENAENHKTCDSHQANQTICKTAAFWEVSLSNPQLGSNGFSQATNEISVDFGFKLGADSQFSCKFLEELVEFIELVVDGIAETPEAIPVEMRVDQVLLDACMSATSAMGALQTGG